MSLNYLAAFYRSILRPMWQGHQLLCPSRHCDTPFRPHSFMVTGANVPFERTNDFCLSLSCNSLPFFPLLFGWSFSLFPHGYSVEVIIQEWSLGVVLKSWSRFWLYFYKHEILDERSTKIEDSFRKKDIFLSV